MDFKHTIRFRSEIHATIKRLAKERGMSMRDFVEYLVKFFMNKTVLLILLVMVGCSSAQHDFVKVDEVNEMRFRHSQKIEVGLDMQTVLNRFGSPQSSTTTYYGGRPVIVWLYYNHIACDNFTCKVMFDAVNKKVSNFYNWRIEFNNNVQY